MYQALYRKYRPKSFSDVVGQSAITKTLQNAVSTGKISHAYLFTGTRGTGKTTCAKILAAAVNCEHSVNGNPCFECESCKTVLSGCTDIVEMDAASNNGVNDVRELREQIAFLPTALKYRVYIIDEVHMLSGPAFNALLKTLEEPPSHVIFVLATTEVHKLPATILSRCQRYDFKRIDSAVIKERLLKVSKEEGFVLEDTAADLIAALAEGGMRDGLSILDQCSGCSDTVTEQVVTEICGIADFTKQNDFVAAVANAKADAALKVIDLVYASSIDLKRFCDDLLMYFRNMLVVKTVKDNRPLIVTTTEQYETVVKMAENFKIHQIMAAIDTIYATKDAMRDSNKRAEMELCAIRLCSHFKGVTLEELNDRLSALEGGAVAVKKPIKTEAPKSAEPKIQAEPIEEIPLPTDNDIPKTEDQNGLVVVTKWPEILEEVKKNNKLFFGALYGSKAYIKDGRVLIDAKNEQFRTMINGNPQLKEMLKDSIKTVLGQAYNIGPYVPPKKEEIDPLIAFTNSLN